MTVPKGPIQVPVANYDGEIYMLEVDASGFLRVVTETTALPIDAATEPTLALIRSYIGALTSPASGSVNKQLEQIRGYVDNLETLLNGGLPAVLDGTALKTKEQSPITGFATDTEVQAVRDRLGALTSPATGSVNKQLELLRGHVDNLETLLNGGLPAALDGTALKTKEQSPLTGLALATGQVSALSELEEKLETADLNITTSKELAVLLTALVGAVETSLVAHAGGVLKTAPGYGNLVRVSRIGALASGAGFTDILNTSGPGILEAVELSSNSDLVDIEVQIDGDWLYTLHPNGTALVIPSPKLINDLGGETPYWKSGLYDTANNLYSAFLKGPVQYNATIIVGCRQETGASKNVALQCWYRGIS